jgi:hypothetical protein
MNVLSRLLSLSLKKFDSTSTGILDPITEVKPPSPAQLLVQEPVPDSHPDRVILRDRHRELVRGLGGDTDAIESITGNCLQQCEMQIHDMRAWLSSGGHA